MKGVCLRLNFEFLRQASAFRSFEFETNDNFQSKEDTQNCILCIRTYLLRWMVLVWVPISSYGFLLSWGERHSLWGKLPFRFMVRFPSLIGLIRERQNCIPPCSWTKKLDSLLGCRPIPTQMGVSQKLGDSENLARFPSRIKSLQSFRYAHFGETNHSSWASKESKPTILQVPNEHSTRTDADRRSCKWNPSSLSLTKHVSF